VPASERVRPSLGPSDWAGGRALRPGEGDETTADAIASIDGAGTVRSFNQAAERMFGYSAAEMIGRPVSLLVSTAIERAGHASEPVAASRIPAAELHGPCLGHRRNGSTFPAELEVVEVDGLDLFRATVRDLSERHRDQTLIADVAIAEQVRIGRDLHDTVGQELAALAFFAERASRELECRPGAEVLMELARGIRGTLAHVRAAARGLTLVADDAESLFLALKELAALVETTHGIACDLEAEAPGAIPADVANHLYRIASEAVANAAHHARPRRIRIRLAPIEGRLTLHVADDGIGIAEETEGRGIGTWIMRSRAAAIGAELEIESGPADGTVVTCRLKGGELGTAERSEPEARPARR